MEEAPQTVSGTPTGHADEPSGASSTARLEEQVTLVENALIDAEVAVETLRVELDNLALAHHQRLGPTYRRLDELEALIAETIAARTGAPGDVRRAHEARGVLEDLPDLDALFSAPGADTSQDPDGDATVGGQQGGGRHAASPQAAEPEAPRRVRPSKKAQRLYRELARRAHPDLTQDPEDKERRSAFIARVNDAYGRGDESALLALADEWMAAPADASEREEAGRARRLLGRLEWMRSRIGQLTEEHERLEASPMGQLRQLAPDDPDTLLLQLAEQLLAEVAKKEAELAELA